MMRFYAIPVFVKPGKHQYLIKYRDSTEHDQRKALSRRAKNEKLSKTVYAEDQIEKTLQPDLFVYDTHVAHREEELPECKLIKMLNLNVIYSEKGCRDRHNNGYQRIRQKQVSF